jgi:hypothetical protein
MISNRRDGKTNLTIMSVLNVSIIEPNWATTHTTYKVVTGVEPVRSGFADRRVSTSPHHRLKTSYDVETVSNRTS